jgi:hypothetical protein
MEYFCVAGCGLAVRAVGQAPGTWPDSGQAARSSGHRTRAWENSHPHAESAARSSAWNISELVIDPAVISPSTPPPSWLHRRPRRPPTSLSPPPPRTASRHPCSPEPTKTLPATSRLVSASIARVRSGAPTLLGETAGLPC